MTDRYADIRAALEQKCSAIFIEDVDAIRALLAERDALRDALQKVRPVIAADRQGLIETHGLDGQIPADDEPGRLGLYEYGCALADIDAALAQHQGEKHGDV